MGLNIKWIGSPFYSKGRSQKINRIVVHWMNGTLKSTDATFQTGGISAHYGIENNNVHQYVLEKDTAWHAISANPFSIGIEHSAAPGRPPTAKTYETSARLIASICKRFKLDPRKVLEPHAKYVATRCPGTDKNGKPKEKGYVDISKLKKMAYNYMKEAKPDMLTTKSYNEKKRFYHGQTPTSGQLKRYVGKVTNARMTEMLKSSPIYKKRIAEAKSGILNYKEHLPLELRIIK